MAKLTDRSGVVVFDGEIENGGSQPPGSFATEEFLITEQATPGTYSASFPIPRYATVWDVLLIPLAIWDADSHPVLNVSDTQGGVGSYWADYPLTNLSFPWDPTAATTGSAGGMWNSVSDEGGHGTTGYRGAIRYGQNAWPPGVTYYDADDEITIQVVTTLVPTTPTGKTLIRIRYTTPIQPTDVAFA